MTPSTPFASGLPPTAAENPSNSLLPAASSEISIEQFLECLQNGIKQWEKAGQILVKLKFTDPDIFKKVLKRPDAQWLTPDILWCFHRMGQGLIYPQALLFRKCPASQELLKADYETQKRLCNAPIEVVTEIKNNNPVVRQHYFTELGRRESGLVLKNGEIQNVDAQVNALKQEQVKPIPPVREPEKDTRLNPIIIPKKLHSLGAWSVVFYGDEPVLIKSNNVPDKAQVVILHPHDRGTLLGVIEFKKWIDTKV